MIVRFDSELCDGDRDGAGMRRRVCAIGARASFDRASFDRAPFDRGKSCGRSSWLLATSVAIAALALVALLLLTFTGGDPQTGVEEHASTNDSLQATSERPAQPEASALGLRTTALDPGAATPRSLVATEVAAPAIQGIVTPREGLDFENVRCALFPSLSVAGGSARWGDAHHERFAEPRIPPTHEVRPDDQGHFSLPVDGGFWTLEVEAPGFASWSECSLEPGDFRVVELEHAVGLAVHVNGPQGLPLEDAWVELCHDSAGQLEPAQRASTDRAGIAKVYARAGHYTLWVGHRQHLAAGQPVVLEPPGQEYYMTVQLEAGWALEGRVATPEGTPAPAGSKVRVEVSADLRAPVLFTVEPDGTWRTGHVYRSGQAIEVAALAPGFGEVRVERELSIPAASEPLRVDLILWVPERRLHGVAVDVSGAGVPGARVFVQPLLDLPPQTRSFVIPADLSPTDGTDTRHEAEASFAAKRRPVSQTDASGRFEVAGLDPTRAYAVSLVSDRHSNRLVWVYPDALSSTWDLGEVVLPSGATFFGRIVTAQGMPVGHLAIQTVWREEKRIVAGQVFESKLPDSYEGAFDTTTNADGEFRFSPLPAGKFYLYVQRQLLGPFEARAGESVGPETVVVDRDQRVDPKVEVLVEGTVSGVDGGPLEKAWMRLLHADATNPAVFPLIAMTRVDAQGRFQFQTPETGSFRIEAVDLSGQHQNGFLEFESDRLEGPLNFILTPHAAPPHRLHGTILDALGQPRAGLTLELLLSPDRTGCGCIRWPAVSDASGHFDFGQMLEGTHQLFIRLPAPDHARSLPVRPRSEPWEIWLNE